MRFIDDGPDIPDELLWAQDEGRVVFFCGAGVSRARANLPDFNYLTAKVLDRLGADHDSPARRLHDVAQSVETDHNLTGVVTSDRVFGLLEREFTREQIEATVANVLASDPDVDLSAHRTLLKLGTLQTGQTRIVTTNFDRLFEAARKGIVSTTRSNLPQIAFNEADWGIVHLHGVVDTAYSGSTDDGFVLSSSSFGDAYLAAGWAREFVKNVLERHVAVFVGYSADDPPIRYLLEGLKQSDTVQGRAFAFQSANQKSAVAEWDEKGVVPILYETTEGCGHRTLWESLDKWARRSSNPRGWRDRTLKSASRGPRKLSPAERGAVAHIVRSAAGAKAFAQFSPPLPSEWLCVFDPVLRYAEPSSEDGSYEKARHIDPFDLYRLDSDHPPLQEEKGGVRTRRMPPNTWGALEATPGDLRSAELDNIAHIRGYFADEMPRLCRRIDHLADWIGRTANEAACVWWAGQQGSLHPAILERVQHHLKRNGPSAENEAVWDAWQKITEYHSLKTNPDSAYELNLPIEGSAPVEALARKYSKIYEPGLKLGYGRRRPTPPRISRKLKSSELVSIEVDYSEGIHQVVVPDEYLLTLVRKLKPCLEFASDLERRYSVLSDICSIEPDEPEPDEGDSSFERSYKLSGHVILFTDLFRRLAAHSPSAALKELRGWPTEGRIWERLRVWGHGNLPIAAPDEYADVLLELNSEAFWPFKGERDFLLGLSRRWEDISKPKLKLLERRILAGPKINGRGKTGREKAHAAQSVLRRLLWLEAQGCEFSFDLPKEVGRLKEDAPDWQDHYARRAARARDGGGGTVRVDTDFSVLNGLKSEEIIPKLLSMSPQSIGKLVDYQPFSGLSESEPQRALDALLARLADGYFEAGYWGDFLRVTYRKGDEVGFSMAIVDALCKLAPSQFQEISNVASSWFEVSATELLSHAPTSYDRMWSVFVETLGQQSLARESNLVEEGGHRDWATAAINSAPGNLAQMLCKILDEKNYGKNEGLPASWKQSAQQLLLLPQDARRFVICIFVYRINWLYYVDPEWTNKNLLCVLEHESEGDVDAFWAGFFWRGEVPQRTLYVQLRAFLEEFLSEPADEDHRNTEVIAVFFLAGWKTIVSGKRLVSSEEFRRLILSANDSFRSNILWRIGRLSKNRKEWAEDLIEFLRDVWPMQKSLRTSGNSARLVELALAQKEMFPEVAEIVSTLVTKIVDDRMFIRELRSSEDTLASQFPEPMLKLLYAVLPDNKARWPYGAEAALAALVEAEPSLQSDSRYIQLARYD